MLGKLGFTAARPTCQRYPPGASLASLGPARLEALASRQTDLIALAPRVCVEIGAAIAHRQVSSVDPRFAGLCGPQYSQRRAWLHAIMPGDHQLLTGR